MRMLAVWQGGQVKPAEAPIILPAALQRALVDYVGQAVAEGKVELAAKLTEVLQVNEDLASESERQARALDAVGQDVEAMQRARDALAGRLAQEEAGLALMRGEAEQERVAAEGARTELAKAQLRLEAMPSLEAELATLRAALEDARAGHAAAEQAAAVAGAMQEGESKALAKAEKELAVVRAELAQRQADVYDLSDAIHRHQAVAYEANARATHVDEQLRQLVNTLRDRIRMGSGNAIEEALSAIGVSPVEQATPTTSGKTKPVK